MYKKKRSIEGRTPFQILAATAYATSSIKEKDYSQVLANAPRSSFSGPCMYCGHCTPCSKKIDIAAVNKYQSLSKVSLMRLQSSHRREYESIAEWWKN